MSSYEDDRKIEEEARTAAYYCCGICRCAWAIGATQRHFEGCPNIRPGDRTEPNPLPENKMPTVQVARTVRRSTPKGV